MGDIKKSDKIPEIIFNCYTINIYLNTKSCVISFENRPMQCITKIGNKIRVPVINVRADKNEDVVLQSFV